MRPDDPRPEPDLREDAREDSREDARQDGREDGREDARARSDEAPPGRGREDEGGEDLPSANEILGTLFSESTLWPLLIVMLGSGGAFGAAMLVLAFGDRNVFAAAALALVFAMTIDVVLRARRRPGHRNLAKALLLLWTSAILLATIAVFSGIT